MAPPAQPARRADLVFLAVVGLVAVSLTAAFLLVDMPRLVAVLSDGSGYYLQFARNAAAGRGLTFDGLHRSNGFHPLWMGILVVVFKCFDGNSEFMVRLVGVLAVALIAAATLMFRSVLGTLVSPASARAGSLVYLAMAVFGLNLMETPVLLVTLSALFWVGRRRYLGSGETAAEALVFGLVLGLTILARLEMAFLAVVIGLVSLWRIAGHGEPHRQRSFRHLVYVVLGAAALVGPFLVHNWAAFGSIVPVSGHLESLYPETNLGRLPETLRELGGTRLAALGAALGFLIWYLRTRRRGQPTPAVGLEYLGGATAVLAAAYLVNLCHELLLMKWQLYWHHAALIPLTGAVAAMAWQHQVFSAGSRNLRYATIATVGLFLMLCGRSTYKRAHVELVDDWRRRAYEAAIWLRENTRPEEKAAMRVAEVTGYFSERETVDLLGLAAGIELQDAIRGQKLNQYLDQSGVQYLVQVGNLARTDEPRIQAMGGAGDVADGRYVTAALRFRSELHHVLSDPLTVRREDEVYRSPAPSAENGVVIWRLAASPH